MDKKNRGTRKPIKHRFSWFVARIGKRIYYDPSKRSCTCTRCVKGYVDILGNFNINGVIRRTYHADNIWDEGQNQMGYRYFDKEVRKGV